MNRSIHSTNGVVRQVIRAEEINTRWQQRYLIEDRWYLPTTTGLIWAISKDTDAGDSNDTEIIGESDQYNRSERESKGKVQ